MKLLYKVLVLISILIVVYWILFHTDLVGNVINTIADLIRNTAKGIGDFFRNLF